MKHGRYSLIYQYFQSQIRFGYLKKGDTLPSITACENNDRDQLFHVYLSIQDFLDETIQAYLAEAEQARTVKAQIPFEWRVYRERPQICYSLAAQLIGMILINQEYTPGNFLPSYNEMA